MTSLEAYTRGTQYSSRYVYMVFCSSGEMSHTEETEQILWSNDLWSLAVNLPTILHVELLHTVSSLHALKMGIHRSVHQQPGDWWLSQEIKKDDISKLYKQGNGIIKSGFIKQTPCYILESNIFLLLFFLLAFCLHKSLQLQPICYDEVRRTHKPHTIGNPEEKNILAPVQMGHSMATITQVQILQLVKNCLPECHRTHKEPTQQCTSVVP